MKKVKTLSILGAILLLTGALLTGCGTKEDNKASDTTKANDTTKTSETTNSDTKELKEIIVGASIEPHATILNSDAVKKSLEADGFKIKVVEYTDYIQPNTATEDGSLDANFFQHVPYLNDFNKKNKTNLVPVANIHFEPLGVYAGKTASFDDLKDKAQIAVPNDATNEARALLLLQDAGLIKLTDGIGLEATVKDIIDNPKKLEIVEVEAAQTVKVLQDVDLAVVNGNYALAEGLSASKDALKVEDVKSEAATTYANVLVVKKGNENTDKTKALIKAVTSDETKAFIEEKYKGAVVPVF